MHIIRKLFVVGTLTSAMTAFADEPINYSAEALFGVGNSDLAPYYMSANRHGKLSQGDNALFDLGFNRDFDLKHKISWSYGAEVVTGYSSEALYTSKNPEIGNHSERPAAIWLQQLYGEFKYRSLFLSVGIKDRESAMVNYSLSTGDMIESGNARSIPQVRAGFVDYQDIPLTKHFLQIQGEFGYGLPQDGDWYENHFNYYSGHYNKGGIYHYKRMYFRTKPSNPFSATFGAQSACLFGGDTYYYSKGKLTKVVHNSEDLDAFWQAIIPRISGVEGFIQGQHLGSWDIKLRYRFKNNAELHGYLQAPWEDGSSMGKFNGWDGLWGLEYVAPNPGIVSGAVVEFVQMKDQCGPMHWDPEDEVGTSLSQYQATGADSYYNNGFYNSYSYFGMSIGSPFSKAPLFNEDGSMTYKDTRFLGWHVGIKGNPISGLDYRILASWRKAWGTYQMPRLHTVESTCFLIEATYKIKTVPGLSVKGEFAADFGRFYGDNVAGAVTVSYRGLFNI